MKNSSNKVVTFFRRNGVYLILVLCILAIGLSTTLLILGDTNQDDTLKEPNDQITDVLDPGTQNPDASPDEDVVSPPEENEVPVATQVIFVMPVNTTSYTEYSETMVFNSTLNRYSSHKAMDFYAEEGSSVVAVYDGVVESIDNSFLEGYTIVINHGNGLKSIYNSLADGDNVSVGQAVKKGDVIGEVSVSNRQEYKQGSHLHFEVEENGNLIDPSKYLEIAEK